MYFNLVLVICYNCRCVCTLTHECHHNENWCFTKKNKNKNNNKKMEIVHMSRHQNSFSELQSIVHEKMDT